MVVVEERIWCGGCIDRSGGTGRKRLRSSSSSSLLLEFIFLRKCNEQFLFCLSNIYLCLFFCL